MDSISKEHRKKQAKTLRQFRRIHRWTGIFLFLFFFVVGLSGLLLGWKKHSGELILPKTYTGTSTDLKNWLPLDSLQNNAFRYLQDSVSQELSLELSRIDIRKNKGVVKFVFKNHYWGLQLDGATGKLLHIDKRRSDFIERLHDGSILDIVFKTSHGFLKVFYSTIMGIALLIFTITGFWLWYGPKRMRKLNK